MRTVIFKLGGYGTDGDILYITASDPQLGGASSARYICKGEKPEAYIDNDGLPQKRVIPADTPNAMAFGLAAAINASAEYPAGCVQAQVKGDLLTLACSDIYAPMRWTLHAEGACTETAEEL